LSRHDLGIGTRNLDSGVQASLVVCLDDVSAIDLAGTDTTVVWTLRTWETARGPAIWSVGHIEEGVFLLETEPRLMRLVCGHKLGTLGTVVELVWGSIWIPALGENEDVWRTPEWIGEDGDGSEVDIRVVTRSLTGGGAVKVPLWEVFEGEFAGFWD
jgi:hypothetical protein